MLQPVSGSTASSPRCLRSELAGPPRDCWDPAAFLVDGSRRPKSHRLAGGEEVDFEAPEPETPELEPEAMELRLAFDRTSTCSSSTNPRGLSSIRTGSRVGTLVHGLLTHDVAGGDAERPGIVHRLDRDTSGLMWSHAPGGPPASPGARPAARDRAPLPGARRRPPAALATWANRGADRPRPARSAEALARHRRPAPP